MRLAIELTTSFNTGDFDGIYTHVVFDSINAQQITKTLTVRIDWGRIVDGEWYSGSATKQKSSFEIYSEDYDSVMNASSLGGDNVFEYLFDALTPFAVAQDPNLAGSKVGF